MFSFLTVNDSTVVSRGELFIGNEVIKLSEIDFGAFRYEQRKVIVGLGGAASQSCSRPRPSRNSLIVSSQVYTISVKESLPPRFLVQGHQFEFDNVLIGCGSFSVEVLVYLDIPIQQLNSERAPQHIKDSFHYSQVLNVIFSVSPIEQNAISFTAELQSPVYDGYGQFGFFIANLDSMNRFLVSRYGDVDLDLIYEFTNTELANELFDKGIFILVWGLTPWHYYIHPLKDRLDSKSLPVKAAPDFYGSYKLDATISSFSVVSGAELTSWHTCLSKKWPEIYLPGESETVELELHVRYFDPVGGSYGPMLSTIILFRTEAPLPLQPLLVADIESV
ncbi:hypothetical protein JTA33_25490 [Pseudomonas sp. 20GA0080]|uniref:hypothetical protein n=1 Tax=Pseudomonas alliivorans TaxID=2810613 RepID=UPI001AE481F0|nr:hypothetical protein [Pseudomonas alliivorans]MBP0953802.1 hypothetical protein [Pseudomonas alliivorans]MEE5041004.1 hypothetical protein [Pseudomonas alliivorans]